MLGWKGLKPKPVSALQPHVLSDCGGLLVLFAAYVGPVLVVVT